MQTSQAIARAGLAAWLAAMLLAGCGPSTAPPRSLDEATLNQIWQVFHSYQKGTRPPPRGPADLLPMERNFPAALDSIRSREVLVFWGVGFDEGSEAASTVLAYHMDVPGKGGGVLMQDGTIRTMTAEEFQSARKPPGATTDFQHPPADKKSKRR